MFNLKVILIGLFATTCTAGVAKQKGEIAPFFDVSSILSEFLKSQDPFHHEGGSMSFDEEQITGYFKMSNINIGNFSNLIINKADVGITSVNISLFFEDVFANYDYECDGTLFHFIPVWGKGVTDINLEGAKIGLYAKVKMTGVDKPISLTKTTLTLKLNACHIKITGLFDDENLSEVVAEIMSDFIMMAFNDKLAWINQNITPKLEVVINNLLVQANITPGIILGKY